MTFVNDVKLSTEQKDTFRRARAMKISGLLTGDGVESLRQLVGGTETVGRSHVVKDVAYDVGNESRIVQDLCASRGLRRIFAELFEERLIFTQGVYFCHSPDLVGFPWHFGLQSFAYIRHADMAVSIWFPLDPVDPSGQGGGMAWLPRDYASAFGHSQLLARLLTDGEDTSEHYAALSTMYRDGLSFSTKLFDQFRCEPAFEPGDCVIFDRYVWHRSCPMRTGPLDTRRAFVLRFIDYNARCSKKTPQRLRAWRESDKTKNPYVSKIPDELSDIVDGQLVRESARFASSIPL